MQILDQLHAGFCRIERDLARADNRFAATMLGLPKPKAQAFLSPAIFFPELIRTQALYESQPGHPLKYVSQPFPSYWLVYRSPNGPLGYIDNALHVVHDVGMTALILCTAMNSGLFNVTHYMTVSEGYSQIDIETLPLVAREMLPEFFLCLSMIDAGEREEAEPHALRRANARRRLATKAANRRPLPKFITIRPRAVTLAERETGASGITQCPHNRRGHWRRYKATGRRIWIDSYAVHGGSSVPRDYRVESAR